MVEGHRDAKICPILAAFTGGRDSVSTGSTWAIRCKGSECGWWDENHQNCAVVMIPVQLGELFSSALLQRST